MKQFVLLLVAVVTLLLVHAGDVQAQGRARGGLRMGNVAPVQLLMVDEVQADLKLTDEQKKAAEAVHEEFMTGRRKIFAEVDKDSGERGPKMKELRDKTAEKLAEVLEEPQKKRLQEIVLQVNGASELENKEVAAALKITPEQKKALAEVRKANAKARRDALAALEAGGEGSRGETLTKLQQEGDKKLLEVLTPEQRKQFIEMQGKKLELELFPA
jgi:DNA-binding MarR family transcriptional regulator